jgi:hypothetical protein
MGTGERKRVSWRLIAETLVCCHSDEAPSDDEWDAIMGAMKSISRPELARILVFTYGGAPNATQRAILSEVLKNMRSPISILTPSILARGAGTALRWFNPHIRIFDPEEVEAALDHIQAPQGARRELVTVLSALKRDVSAR